MPDDVIGRLREWLDKEQQRIAEERKRIDEEKAEHERSKRKSGIFGSIKRGALGWLGGALAAGVAYSICLLAKSYEATVRAWIDYLGGSQTLHWIVDQMVRIAATLS